MKFYTVFITLILMLFNGTTLQAKAPIRIAAALAIPPYVLSDSNSGIEVDIVSQALASMGYDVVMQYGAFSECPQLLQDKKVDGAITILESSGVRGVCYTESYITYQNVAVTLAKNKMQIDSIKGLANKSIIAFQNAEKYLGPVYADVVKNHCPDYKELARQDLQLALLFKGSTEVIVLDINIFYYYLNRLKEYHPSIDAAQAVAIHQVFPENHYKAAFWRPEICEAFNEGVRSLKESGDYQKIIDGYLKPESVSAP